MFLLSKLKRRRFAWRNLGFDIMRRPLSRAAKYHLSTKHCTCFSLALDYRNYLVYNSVVLLLCCGALFKRPVIDV